MTEDGLGRVFDIIDSGDADGELSPDEFKEGLAYIGEQQIYFIVFSILADCACGVLRIAH